MAKTQLGKLDLRTRALLMLDGEASEANELRDIVGKWIERTFIEGEEDELESG